MLTTILILEKQFHCIFVCSFILDCMNSVGFSELNIVFDVFILVWSGEKNDPILENVSVLIFRLVWKN